MKTIATSPQWLRRVNSDIVLAATRCSEVVTGSQLIEQTGLTRATVIAICDDLVAAGWVREIANQRLAGGYIKGRPARRFQFNRQAGYVLGIDVGVAKVSVVVADLLGEGVGTVTLPFRSSEWVVNPAGVETDRICTDRVGTVDRAARVALDEAGLAPTAVLAVSIGVAAPVDRSGRIFGNDRFWRHFDINLPKILAERHGWNVRLENDANLAALAEGWRGAAQGVQDYAVLLAGDRFGTGLVESGRLLHGSRGGSGEMGFLDLVEGVGSPDGIAHMARSWARQMVTRARGGPLWSRYEGQPESITAEMVFDAAAHGDPDARRITDRIAARTARVIASLCGPTDPELVVIGGAVAASAGAMLDEIAARLPGLTALPPRVVASELGARVVALGAIRHALDYVEAHALDIELGASNVS